MATHQRIRSSKALLLAGASFAAFLATVPAVQAEVGVAAAVNRDARSRPPGAPVRVVTLGQQVVYNEQVTTDPNGQVQILLLDGTTFTVGPSSNITIDEFVFNPNTGQAKVVASVTRGAFRFIGARTSQTPGGATIDAPVGTIGVRGGSVICGVVGNEILCAMPFGKEVNVVGKDGVNHRLYKPGWLLAFDLNGNYVETRKASLRELGGLNAALQGKGKGGAITSPDDGTVAGSDVPDTNSRLPNTIPLSVILEAVKANPRIEQVENDIAQQTIEQDIAENEEPTTFLARVLTAENSEDGQNGIVGTTDPTSQPLTFIQEEGPDGPRLVSAVGGYNLPDYTGTQGDTVPEGAQFPVLDEFIIGSGGDSASGPGGTLEGIAYAGAGDFVAYFMGAVPASSDFSTLAAVPASADPVYVIVGTPAPDTVQDGMLNGGNIRRYTLTPDPLQDAVLPSEGPNPQVAVVPFFSAQDYGPITAGPNLSSTDFYVVEGNQPTSQESKGFQSWVHIEGEGANQRSAVGVNVGTMADNSEGQLEFLGQRGGSYSTPNVPGEEGDFPGDAVAMGGEIGSVPGGSGGHVFGQDGNHMVLGNRTGINGGTFEDDFLGGSPRQHGTMHVATLADIDPQSGASRVTSVQERSGFMTGMAETSFGSTYVLTNAPAQYDDETESWVGQPNLTIRKSPGSNEFSAEANLFDAGVVICDCDDSGGQDYDVESYLLTFGNHNENSDGESAYVDETKFGATQDNNLNNNTVTGDGYLGEGEEWVEGPTNNLNSVDSYMVSGRANPVQGFQHCTTCTFIDWGWWGSTAGSGSGEGARTDQVHMGTWVAGDITAPGNLPADLGNVDDDEIYGNNIVATYSGTALGTVSRQTGGTTSTYQAAGTMEMEYDFGDRSGHLAINDFDGMSVSGYMYNESSSTQTLFGGNLYNSTEGPFLYGTASGAIVDNNNAPGGPNVAAGVMGSFNFGGSGVSATGTFVGERGADAPSNYGSNVGG